VRYGVVLNGERADAAATAAKRVAAKAERKSSAQKPRRAPLSVNGAAGPMVAGINDYLSIVQAPAGPVVRCRCGCVLSPASEDYHQCLAVRETAGQTHPLGRDRETPGFALREFFCPNCWTVVDTAVAMQETEV
jgi:N-methylhydantoinase B